MDFKQMLPMFMLGLSGNSGEGLGNINNILMLSVLMGSSGSGSNSVPYSSMSGLSFGDETIKILSIPISRQLLDTVSLKLSNMGEEQKNQLISSMLLMLIADKEGGDVGEMLSMAAMMGLNPLMSSLSSPSSNASITNVRVYKPTQVKPSQPVPLPANLSRNKVGGTSSNSSDLVSDVKNIDIDRKNVSRVSNNDDLHKQYLDAKAARRNRSR